MRREPCNCQHLWFERHELGCPRRNDVSGAEAMRAALFRRHPFAAGEWVAWPEFRHIDFYAMRFWRSGGVGQIRVGYEIKVSRADFLSEIRNPDKRIKGMQICERFYFACPKGLVAKREIPDDCGLVEVDEQGKSRVLVPSPIMVGRPFREDEILYLLRLDMFRSGAGELRRRVSRLEETVKYRERTIEKLRLRIEELEDQVAA